MSRLVSSWRPGELQKITQRYCFGYYEAGYPEVFRAENETMVGIE
jgi:hypothetical protein